MHRKYLCSLTSAAVLLLTACGDSSSSPGDPPGPPDPPTGAALLQPVGSADELKASLLDGMSRGVEPSPVNAVVEEDLAAAPPEDAGAGFSATYTQEIRVDEMDVVKYDGQTLYIAPSRGHFGCCFPLAIDADAVIDRPPNTPRAIRVMQTDSDTATVTPITDIELGDGESVQGLYLHDDQLVAITTDSYHGRYGELWGAPDIWSQQAVGVTVYDVADPSAPAERWRGSFDGGFVQTRRIGNVVYLISRHTPLFAIPESGQVEEADVNIEELLPQARHADEPAVPLVQPTQCFVTRDPGAEPFGYPVLTTITAIPLDDPTTHRSVCYNEDAYGVYVSENAVYLHQARQDSLVDSGRTRIHKFRLDGTTIRYAGSGEVSGFLWSGGQADFRASEADGNLRVLTTSYSGTANDFLDHHLYVLREDPAELSLETIAELPNAARPQEIGKPNEALYGVRFLGDRAYAVTFEQIDPLYVIDLSNPADPFVAGELEVRGFSDFLHPVSNGLLLGLGQADDGGIKLELFDVADISNPLSVGSHAMGGRGSWSEARWDRHAFTYLAVSDNTDRFTVPADLYSDDDEFRWLESGLYQFEVRDKGNPTLASLVPVGSMVVERPSPQRSWPVGQRNRAVLHDDAVFYVRDDDVWTARWGEFGTPGGPF